MLHIINLYIGIYNIGRYRYPLLWSYHNKRHTPFKPHYVLPDYAKYLQQGSQYLELTFPRWKSEYLGSSQP
jgi:hypothetical protein